MTEERNPPLFRIRIERARRGSDCPYNVGRIALGETSDTLRLGSIARTLRPENDARTRTASCFRAGISASHFVARIVGFFIREAQQNSWPRGDDSNSIGRARAGSSFCTGSIRALTGCPANGTSSVNTLFVSCPGPVDNVESYRACRLNWHLRSSTTESP